jgi:hypothetical protein
MKVMQQNSKNYARSARFLLVDKIALLMCLLSSLLFLSLWLAAFFVVGSLGARHMWGSFGIPGVGLVILAVGTIWFMMRATDFLLGWYFGWPLPGLVGREPAPASFEASPICV